MEDPAGAALPGWLEEDINSAGWPSLMDCHQRWQLPIAVGVVLAAAAAAVTTGRCPSDPRAGLGPGRVASS